MIMRLSLSLAMAVALATTACAREADNTQTETANIAAQSDGPTLSSAEARSLPDYDYPDAAWRDLTPENTMYVETDFGRIIVELAPEFAPAHVERMKTLSRELFYNRLVWHRVMDGFMAQGGGARNNRSHAADLPPLNSEFTIRRGGEMQISELQDRVINASSMPQIAKAGFWNGFQAGTQALAAAGLMGDGRVDSWLLHCRGAASMARTSDPNSARSQFYLTRGHANHLNAQYTVWGRIRYGQAAVDALRVGTLGETSGFEPDVIRSMRVAADLPEAQRTRVQVLDTNSTAFTSYLDTLRNRSGDLPDICDITVPTRILE